MLSSRAVSAAYDYLTSKGTRATLEPSLYRYKYSPNSLLKLFVIWKSLLIKTMPGQVLLTTTTEARPRWQLQLGLGDTRAGPALAGKPRDVHGALALETKANKFGGTFYCVPSFQLLSPTYGPINGWTPEKMLIVHGVYTWKGYCSLSRNKDLCRVKLDNSKCCRKQCLHKGP